ncbi:serine/threonine receptor-like kinase NFP [Argentina anserina]|uniref:serine/threonine receptor-like kinase NFP n=1 Tax=Argentina anserina TaxID=57926 RepID=UPI00217652AD|nr:serine/threonine receptor-like kinase NFP [Potentilla anserina]
MRSFSPECVPSLFVFFLCFHLLHLSEAQGPTTEGYTCSANDTTTTNPCQAYVYYRAMAPDFLDLASIADLFLVSRPMISKPSNISSPSSPLVQDQALFVPISCSCKSVNSSMAISFANLSYTINKGDTFYQVSSHSYQNLTTYQSVELANPTLVATNLTIGVTAYFPIFCKCPNKTQLQNKVNYLVSYVFQPSDNLSEVASRFGVQAKSIVEVNGNITQPFDTIFIPVTQLPVLSQPIVSPSPPGTKNERKGVITGLAVGLGITGFLLILVVGVVIFGGGLKRRRGTDEEKNLNVYKSGTIDKMAKEMEVSLMADVSDCLDKYRVFGIEELREATNGFGNNCLIEGSVYKGNINGVVYAIKKMKWNACEELKILQKVNHGNLVKLEGFCIDPEDVNCYLVYEYVENGSLNSWLHENQHEKLSWKTRLHIAADVANGLQYIHEHARPQVVHKDIKSGNILLDSNMRAKIANFGLAKSGCNAITMHIVGTQGYIAPEYLTDGMVSTKMDVFSFGVVLLELLTGKEAIDEAGNVLWASAGTILEGSEEEKSRKLKQWMDKEPFLESCSMESVVNVATVAIACLHKDPSKRPSMVDIVYAFCKSDALFFDISYDGSSASPVRAR